MTPGQWTELPNTRARACMANGGAGAGWNPRYILDYSGAVYDPRRDEMLVWGGGHGDYPGNEVLAFRRATATWSALTVPSPYTNATVEALADGRPASRHTSSALAWVPEQDGFVAVAGSLWSAGHPCRGTWFFHREPRQWERLPDLPTWGESDYGANTLFSQVAAHNGRVYARLRTKCAEYSFAARQWELKNWTDGTWQEANRTGIFDPARRRLICLGRGASGETGFEVWQTGYATAPFWRRVPATLTGPGAGLATAWAPGLAYDPLADRYLAWNMLDADRRRIYTIDPTTFATGVIQPTAGPAPVVPAGLSPGVYSRMQYVPSEDALAVVTDIDANVFAFTIPRDGTLTYRSPQTLAVSVA